MPAPTQRDPWRSRGRRVAEPRDDSDDNDSRRQLPCGMKCGTTRIVRRKRTLLPDSSIDCSTPSPIPIQSQPERGHNSDDNDGKKRLRSGNENGARKIVRRERTPLPDRCAHGSIPGPAPSLPKSDSPRVDMHRVAEPCDDPDDNYGKKRARASNQVGMSKIVRRKRTPLSHVSGNGSTLSPTPAQPNSDSSWVDLRDISAHCASAQTLVEACQVLARSIPTPTAPRLETETLDEPISDAYSTYLAGFAQHSLRSQPQIRSHHQRRNHTKRSSPFLDLPAEIRNLVYEHLVPAARIHVISSRPNQELQALNEDWSTTLFRPRRPRRRLCHLSHATELGEEYRIEWNILLVCRQVKLEAEFFFYSRPTFRFDSCNNITRFLNRASKRGISAIEKISLCDPGYGDPRWSEDIIWQLRYYQKWDRTCAQVGQSFPSLKHLKLEANLAIWPLKYCNESSDISWKESVLLLTPQKIDKVEVELSHRREKNQSLIAEWQYKLENKMMTEAGRRRRDE